MAPIRGLASRVCVGAPGSNPPARPCGQPTRRSDPGTPGRQSISGRVDGAGVREEDGPAAVATAGVQTHQRLSTCLVPERARALKPHWVLPAGRCHRPAAQGLAFLLGRPVVQTVQVGFPAGLFLFDRRARQGSNSVITALLASALSFSPIGHDQHFRSPTQAVPPGCGPSLFLAGVHHAAARHRAQPRLRSAGSGESRCRHRPRANARGVLPPPPVGPRSGPPASRWMQRGPKRLWLGGPGAGRDPAQFVLAVGTEGRSAIGFLRRGVSSLGRNSSGRPRGSCASRGPRFWSWRRAIGGVGGPTLSQGFPSGGQEALPRGRGAGRGSGRLSRVIMPSV